MYYKSLIIIFFCLVLNVAFAQQTYLDSLQNKLLASAQDTNRVKILARLANIHTNYDSAVIYAQQGITLAKKKNFPRGEAACYLGMGNAYAAILDELKAVESFQKSLEIYRKLQDKKGIWDAIGGPARIYYLEKDFRRELSVHFKLEKLSREFNSPEMLLHALRNIGSTYYELDKWDSAEIYLRQGFALSHQSTSNGTIAILAALADLLLAKGKNDEALYYLHKSLEFYLKEDDRQSIGETYSSLSQAYLNNNQTDSALFYAKKSFAIAKAPFYDSLKSIIVSANQLSLLYERQKNFKEALYFHKIAKAAQDSASVKERISKLSAFAYREKQREREKIAEEKHFQNQVLLYASFVALFVFLLIVLILYRNNRNNQKAKTKIEKAYTDLETTQEQLIEAEKMASIGKLQQAVSDERLRISRELHDEVGATLSSISIFSQAAIQKSESGNVVDSKNILERIGETSREVMGELNDTVWLINPLNDNLQKIIQRISNYALPLCRTNSIHFEIKASASVENLDLSMEKRKAIYLITKEAVNNSLKYASAKNLVIQFDKNHNVLHISIKDDGCGFTEGNSSSGNGLSNMKQRAKDVKGKVDFDSVQQKGTEIILQVPLTNIGD